MGSSPDASRFPEGLLFNVPDLTAARPVNTIVETSGALHISTDSVTPAYSSLSSGIARGTTSPDGVVTGNRGDLYIGSTGLQGNPTLYQNVHATTGTDWNILGVVGDSDIGLAAIWGEKFSPSGATAVRTANGVVSTDICVATIMLDDTGASLATIIGAQVTTNTVTVTFSNGAGLNSDGIVSVVVYRP